MIFASHESGQCAEQATDRTHRRPIKPHPRSCRAARHPARSLHGTGTGAGVCHSRSDALDRDQRGIGSNPPVPVSHTTGEGRRMPVDGGQPRSEPATTRRAADPLCPTCGGLCWTDGATALCRDCGGAGRLPLAATGQPNAVNTSDHRARAARLIAAWMLTQGDVLADRTTIIAIARDPLTRRVGYTTDRGEFVSHDGETLVVVIERALDAQTESMPSSQRPSRHPGPVAQSTGRLQ